MRHMRQWMWLSAVMLTTLLVHADNWSAPATELATHIVGKVGPGSAIALTVNNRSSLSTADVRSITSQVESQLRAARMDIVASGQAVATVNVTLSENAQGYLWIAEIQQGSGTDVVMQTVVRQQAGDMRGASALTLRRKLLITRHEPILDVELRSDSAALLTPTRVTWYRIQGATWQELQSAPLTYRRAMPRDVRGRLWSNSTTVLGVSLPGVRCTQPAGSTSLSCTETDDPWPLYTGAGISTEAFFSPVRNFFNGTVAFYDPQKQVAGPASYTVPPFYSMASVIEDGLPLWLFASVDGRVMLFGGKTGTVPKASSIQGWGSDIGSVTSSCGDPLKPNAGLNGAPSESPLKPTEGLNGAPGSELFVIASRAGDRSKPDAVQAFRVVNREAMPAAPSVEFAGPVTALWTSSVDSAQAIAVAHNLTTGEYEAYSLSLVCSQ